MTEATIRSELEDVLERVRTWPAKDQEEVAMLLLALEERRKGIYELSDEEVADLDRADREIERGELVPDEEMKALFDRYRHG